MARHVGLQWKLLDNKSRAYYVDLAVKDKARYDREMKEYSRKKAAVAATVHLHEESPESLQEAPVDMNPIELYQENPKELCELANHLGDDLIHIVSKACS